MKINHTVFIDIKGSFCMLQFFVKQQYIFSETNKNTSEMLT